jgi:predicted DNA-binding transcriptional regulator AlpA
MKSTETARGAAAWLLLPDIESQYALSPHTVYGLRYRGDFPTGFRVAGRLRFRRDDIDAWIESKADRPREAV